MKKLLKCFGVILVLISICGVVVGIMDKRQNRKSCHKPYGIYEIFFKRTLDFICGMVALICFGWLYILIIVLVRVKLGSPVLFIQDRPGRNEKIFKLYKFRSMTDERDENNKLLPDEMRLTKFGKLLRKTSLDELPEAINIIKGDMSVIGPRPLLVEYLPWYTEKEKHRHDIRPGLSGLAQTHGRNCITWEEKFVWDLKYVNHITFLGDLKIILDTIKKVFIKPEGIELAYEGNLAKIRQESQI